MPLTTAELAQLRITKLVIHQVGPAPGDFTPLKGEKAAGASERFFLDRLAAANLGSSYYFRADSRVLVALRAIRDDQTTLIAHGKALAQAFHEAHVVTSRSGSFVLFVLALAAETLFAIVKFDHHSAVDVTDSEGNVDLDLVEKSISEDKRGMQKSALMRLTTAGGDVIVVDRSPQVAQYFEQFLGVERTNTPAVLTKTLGNVLNKVADEHEADLGAQFIRQLPTRLYDAFQAINTFDPDEDTLLTTVFGPKAQDESIRETFEQQMAQAGIATEQFALDKTVLPRPTRTKIVTTEGIEIVLPNDMRDRIDESRLEQDGILIIRTDGIRSYEPVFDKSRRAR
jgi:hypothetical protein